MEPRLPDRIPALTERQREVADLVAQGLTNAEIGDRLGISLDGAKYHVSELLVRLNLERREQIGEWARANRRGFVRRWGLMALAAVLGSAVAVVAVLVFSGDSSVGPADGDDSEGGASLAATLEPTLEPTSTVGAPAGPIVLGDLTNAERLELLYQPIPWHDGRRANRVPLGADPLAYVMDWAGYQDGYHFVDPPTEGFDPDQLTGPSCVVVFPENQLVQSANWLLSMLPDGNAGRGHYTLELTPSHTDLRELEDPEPELGQLAVSQWPPPKSPVPLRIRAIDTGDWESTHIIESWAVDPADEDGTIRLDYAAPRATRWLMVVTSGPLWGCFYLDTERAVDAWPATGGEIAPSLPAPGADAPAEQPVVTPLGSPPATGSLSRSCVEVGQTSARSGRIGARAFESLWSDWPPNARTRSAGSLWVPQHPSEGAPLNIRAIVDGDDGGPRHAYESLELPPYRAWFDGSDPTSDPPTLAYRGSFLLPLPGTWSLVATVPPVNWGCFVVTVGMSQPIRLCD